MIHPRRFLLLGILILLLAFVRLAMASPDSSLVVDWSAVDQAERQQILTPEPGSAIEPESASPTASSGSEAGAIPQPQDDAILRIPIDQTQVSQSTAEAANHEHIESFLSPRIQKTVQPSPSGVPVRILISTIGLDAPVIKAASGKVQLQGKWFEQWIPPKKFAAGWITTSALLGKPGNTVLSGHHNEYGEVFGRLIDVNVGDTILLFSDSRVYSYKITNKLILKELGVPVSQRIQNASWIDRSDDERLTLVTCWPKNSNTHRLIIVASPIN